MSRDDKPSTSVGGDANAAVNALFQSENTYRRAFNLMHAVMAEVLRECEGSEPRSLLTARVHHDRLAYLRDDE